MSKLSIQKDKIDFCYKNNCISFKGEVMKTITFGIAVIILLAGVASMFDTSK